MSEWVLLLGGSTGHGAATAKRLAKDGYGVIAFHFDSFYMYFRRYFEAPRAKMLGTVTTQLGCAPS